jgi:hypothetical protein
MPGRLPTGGTCGDDLGDYVKKTVAAHHGCIQDHYAVLKQTAAEQAPDPQRTAGQATAEQAGTGPGWSGPGSDMTRSRS